MKQNGTSKPTLSDVAVQAGVSPATVSRVVNQTAPVSEETRERVKSAMADLGYKPSGSRQSNTSSRIKAVALLVTDILNPFFAEIVRGVEDEAEAEGLALVLFNTTEDAQREERTLCTLRQWALDGVILFGSRLPTQELLDFQKDRESPLVIMNRHMTSPQTACILVDSEKATYRAAEYLLNLGHRKIAYLAGPSTSESSQARKNGVERALQEAGLSLPPAWCPVGFPNLEGGFQAMSNLLATDKRPTAVLAYNDMMALGALRAIRTYNLDVPKDVSIIGFDDISMAAHANPPLTTIIQPKYQMGRLAVQLLRRLRRGEEIPGNGCVMLESLLVVRESTTRLASKL